MRTLRWACLLVLALVPAVAWAQGVPHTDVVMIAPDGTIVGVGVLLPDGGIDLQVLPSYQGPATLILTLPGRAPRTLQVVLADGGLQVRGAEGAALGEPDLADLPGIRVRPGKAPAAGSPAGGRPSEAGPPAEPGSQKGAPPAPGNPPPAKPDDPGAPAAPGKGKGNAG